MKCITCFKYDLEKLYYFIVMFFLIFTKYWIEQIYKKIES